MILLAEEDTASPKNQSKVQLADRVKKGHYKSLRVWSAACSTGQEAYSVAMQLCDSTRIPFEVYASDINVQVLEQARIGRYPIHLSEEIPLEYRQCYCLRGVRTEKEYFRICDQVREKVTFDMINLSTTLPYMEAFDIIFLRSVLIYFSPENVEKIVNRVKLKLKPDGY